LEGWIVACHLGIASQPSKFRTEGKKIIWALSFLDGPPRSWAQLLINAYLLNPEDPPPPELVSFDTLVDALRACLETQTLREPPSLPSTTSGKPPQWQSTARALRVIASTPKWMATR